MSKSIISHNLNRALNNTIKINAFPFSIHPLERHYNFLMLINKSSFHSSTYYTLILGKMSQAWILFLLHSGTTLNYICYLTEDHWCLSLLETALWRNFYLNQIMVASPHHHHSLKKLLNIHWHFNDFNLSGFPHCPIYFTCSIGNFTEQHAPFKNICGKTEEWRIRRMYMLHKWQYKSLFGMNYRQYICDLKHLMQAAKFQLSQSK